MATRGYVFCIANDATPNFLTIGATRRDTQCRLREANSAKWSVPSLLRSRLPTRSQPSAPFTRSSRTAERASSRSPKMRRARYSTLSLWAPTGPGAQRAHSALFFRGLMKSSVGGAYKLPLFLIRNVMLGFLSRRETRRESRRPSGGRTRFSRSLAARIA